MLHYETPNSRGAVTHKVEIKIYFKGHMEKVRMDMCNLGKADVILGMPWLSQHNPKINWKTGEVKMTRCPKTCGDEKKKKN